MTDSKLYEKAKILYDVLIDVSTGKSYDGTELISNYETTRKLLMANKNTSNLLPDIVKNTGTYLLFGDT